MHILQRLAILEHWRNQMDAQVTHLVAEVGELKQDVTDLSAAMDRALARLTTAIDAEDEAAITQAVTDLETVHAGLQTVAAKSPAPPAATTAPVAPPSAA